MILSSNEEFFMFKYLVMVTTFLGAVSVSAQEYGAILGVHQTDADVKSSSEGSVDGKMGFKAGMAITFELGDETRFRTGALFTQRHLEIANGSGIGDTKILFDYIDVPVNLQYNLNDKFGLFGGFTVGVNVNDKVEYPEQLASKPDPDVEKMIPILNAGVSLTFDDMIGFDFYYERGLGEISNSLEKFNTFGLNFLYWF
jgi:hypothetical protein